GMAEVWGRLNFVAGLCASELEKLQPLWQQLQQLRELLGQQQGASQGIQGAAERIRRILTGLIQG
ncbi:MAG: hypothetical protein Q6K99_10385, partial [Thermostichales cyanobacterium BF4_bins_65]